MMASGCVRAVAMLLALNGCVGQDTAQQSADPPFPTTSVGSTTDPLVSTSGTSQPSTLAADNAATTADPCAAIECSIDCNGTCGWSYSAMGCRTGETTSQSERYLRLGNCSSESSTGGPETTVAAAVQTTTAAAPTDAPSAAPTVAPTVASDQCTAITCIWDCRGVCGWDLDDDVCRSGLTTSEIAMSLGIGCTDSTTASTTVASPNATTPTTGVGAVTVTTPDTANITTSGTAEETTLNTADVTTSNMAGETTTFDAPVTTDTSMSTVTTAPESSPNTTASATPSAVADTTPAADTTLTTNTTVSTTPGVVNQATTVGGSSPPESTTATAVPTSTTPSSTTDATTLVVRSTLPATTLPASTTGSQHSDSTVQARGCQNNASYVDKTGFRCADWVSFSCLSAASAFGFTNAEQTMLLYSCPAACGLCAIGHTTRGATTVPPETTSHHQATTGQVCISTGRSCHYVSTPCCDGTSRCLWRQGQKLCVAHRRVNSTTAGPSVNATTPRATTVAHVTTTQPARATARSSTTTAVPAASNITATCLSLDGWHDMLNRNCHAYAAKVYCFPNGTAGSGWAGSWATKRGRYLLNGHSEDGVLAKDACCACGGGTAVINSAGVPSNNEDSGMNAGRVVWPLMLTACVVLVGYFTVRARRNGARPSAKYNSLHDKLGGDDFGGEDHFGLGLRSGMVSSSSYDDDEDSTVWTR
eukprot:m.221368 g.221368  ORF g.221368 m.221368 type:complete len:704 (+) comp25802_c0_seq1:320-2431(+)